MAPDLNNHFPFDEPSNFHTILVSIPLLDKIMYTTVSTKFQVVIPRPIREHLKIMPRQKLTVIEKDGMLIIMPQKSLAALRGIAAGASTDDYRDKKDRYKLVLEIREYWSMKKQCPRPTAFNLLP